LLFEGDEMSRTIDCLLIGHNEMRFGEYEETIARMGLNSNTYRDLNLNFIRYNNTPYSAAEIFNYLVLSEHDPGTAPPAAPLSMGQTFSAAVAYLGSYLHRRGLSFDYINAFQEEKEALKRKLQDDHIVTIAVTTTLYVSVFPILEIMKFIRQYNTTAKVVVGGPFVATQVQLQEPAVLQSLFHSIGADFYVNSSQGEAALVQIIRALKGKRPLERIPNIYYIPGGSDEFSAAPVSREDNRLAENMVRWDLFAHPPVSHVGVRTAISCPFSCAFCGFPQHAGAYQTAGVEEIEDELNGLDRLGTVKSVNFIDDTFNVPVKRFKEILRMMVKNRYAFQWNSHFRCQFADREMVALMKESGCQGVFLGIESGSNRILEAMNKAAAVEKYLRGIELLKAYGITTFGSFIVGFPGETEETAAESREFIRRSGLDFFRAQLWYCDTITPIWAERKKYGLEGSHFEWRHATMEARQACAIIEEQFLTIEECQWVPQYNFEFDAVFHLLHRGFSLQQVKGFLRAFIDGVREKLTCPAAEVSMGVLQRLRDSLRNDSDENLRLFSTRYVNQKAYWKTRLSGWRGQTHVGFGPVDGGRSSLPGEKEAAAFSFPGSLCRRLLQLSRASDLSLYIILAAGLKALIFRYTHQDDVVVISPVYRHRPSDHPLSNRLYIRDRLNGDISFKQLILAVRQSVLSAFENQDYPYQKLLESIFPPADAQTRQGLSRVVCALTTIHDEGNIAGIDEAALLTFSFSRQADRLGGTVSYHPALFPSPLVKRLIGHLLHLMESLLADVDLGLWAAPLLSAGEEQELLVALNGPTVALDGRELFPRRFAQQVRRAPGRTALVCGHRHISYDHLNRCSQELAARLRDMGVRPDTIVAILTGRSPEMFIGLLGIWQAGGAYLPLDPDSPDSRHRCLLADSGAQIVLCDPLSSRLAGDCRAASPPQPTPLGPMNLAYIIYTSGSTGTPKGVLVAHGNLVAYLAAFAHEFTITGDDTVVQQAAYFFDTFAEEVYPVLLKGGKVAVPQRAEVLDTGLFAAFIVKHRVNIVDCSPLLLNELNRQLPQAALFPANGRRCIFISGGDVLRGEYVERLADIGAVYNTYGPTETTVCAAFFRCHKPVESSVPIGRPVANYRLRILDPAGNPVPAGVVGELAIAGAGVARGYLNHPELTAEKFVNVAAKGREGTRSSNKKSTKSQILNPTSQILYKTGDLVRLRPDGNIAFVGRRDFQVNVRGFRIELGEIESRLAAHPQIREAVVALREDEEQDKYLCAYVVAHSAEAASLSPSELRDFLLEQLPYYMVPAYFVFIKQLPLTASGKVDRSALPQPEISTAGAEYVPPGDEVERRLVAIWSRVLGIGEEKIGIDNNFFELGGHSLKATVVIARINKEWPVKVSMMGIFTAPTIRGLAEYVRQAAGIPGAAAASGDQGGAIEPVEKREYYALSPAQERMYFLQQIDPASTSYNISQVAAVAGDLSLPRLEAAFRQLIKRHESLRTAFQVVDGEPVQRIYGEVDFSVSTDCPANGIRDFIRPFHLSTPPLLRVGVIPGGRDGDGEECILMVDMHHIVSDGVSLTLFIREFLALFGRPGSREFQELPEQKIQYKDFSQWQNRRLSAAAVRQQEAFWLNEFADGVPRLDLPTDFPRPPRPNYEGDAVRFELAPREAGALRQLGQAEEASLFMVLLAVYNVLIFKVGGRQDIVVGTAASCRNHADIQGVIGVFVNVLPFRNFPTPDLPFREFLREVRQRSLAVLENQDYQFEDFFEKVAVTRRGGHHPLYEAGFTLQNIWTGETAGPGTPPSTGRVTPLGYEVKHAKLDMNLEAFELGERLAFVFTYCTGLFRRQTIRRWADYFKKITAAVIENPDLCLKHIEVVSGQEKRAIERDVETIQQEFQVDFHIPGSDGES
jgi:radical SAM PhpK family P-methyltransferase